MVVFKLQAESAGNLGILLFLDLKLLKLGK